MFWVISVFGIEGK